MTCIAGAIKNGEVWMGGDAVSVQGKYAARINARSKVFHLDKFLIGSCGAIHVGQVIEYLFQPPPIAEESNLFRYMVASFAPALRAQMVQHGAEVKNQSSQKDEMDGKA